MCEKPSLGVFAQGIPLISACRDAVAVALLSFCHTGALSPLLQGNHGMGLTPQSSEIINHAHSPAHT